MTSGKAKKLGGGKRGEYLIRLKRKQPRSPDAQILNAVAKKRRGSTLIPLIKKKSKPKKNAP